MRRIESFALIDGQEDEEMRFLMEELVGQRVKVWTEWGETEHTDEGTLEGFDGICLKLRKNNRETLYLTMFKVRLVKPL